MMNNRYGRGGNTLSGIPLSDGAGEVIAVGADVTQFNVGDRVAGTFFPAWVDGTRTAEGQGYLDQIDPTTGTLVISIPQADILGS